MKAFLQSFVFAWRGIRFAWRGRNFRVQVAFALITMILGFQLDITSTEWAAVLILIAMVLSAEIINSSLENLVNFVSPEYHPLAGKIKDLAAGAVLVIAIISVLVGLIIFVPYFLRLLNLPA